jgi:hypothetical protein
LTYVDYFGLAAETNNAAVDEKYFYGEYEPHCFCERHRDCKRGGDVASALGGISHGAVDFIVGSLHDLQTAMVYISSGEMDMILQERVHMIDAVEQSQANRMFQVEGWMMGMLSVDEFDTVYHSFRSQTTMGLEIGSLVTGGYGAVKGVLAFNRLTKASIQAARLANQIRKPALLKAEQIIERLETFLGKDSRLFNNIHGDLLIESKDGLRQFRMDLNYPKPHKNPHTHLIEYEIRKNKKFEIMNERIYPIDVNSE